MMVETITLLKGSLGKKPVIIALRMGNRYLRKPNGKKSARGGCELGSDPTMCDPSDLRAYPWGDYSPLLRTCQPSSCPLVDYPNSVCPTHNFRKNSPEVLVPTVIDILQGMYGNMLPMFGYPTVYSDTLRTNPAGPKSGDVHVLRGGGWNTFYQQAANRFHDLIMGSARVVSMLEVSQSKCTMM